MEREKSWDLITDMGNYVSTRWAELAASYGLNLKLSGLAAMKSFSSLSPDALKI